MNRLTTLGITLGDVGGIGPEVAIKALHAVPWPAHVRFVLIGSAAIAAEQARRLKLPPPVRVEQLDALPPGRCLVWEPLPLSHLKATPGAIKVSAARAAVRWIEAAAAACLDGRLSGMVTAPICKEGLQRAGLAVPGHTELLAALTGTQRFAMLLMGGGLRVVLVTRHTPLARVCEHLTAAAIIAAAELTAAALPWLGVRNPRVGVCGVNPHAGDGGALGREELDIIAPAVRTLQRRGLPVAGPVPADVIFYQARRGRYGAVLAMYHDQGLGPLKMLAFEHGVNVTLGLPIVRTSPDHGTAFDIAGQGVADARSMVAAMRLACRLARRPNPWAR